MAFSGEQSLTFKQSVMEIVPPVSAAEILSGGLSASVKNKDWPEELSGWVSKEQVMTWLADVDKQHIYQWSGQSSAWIRKCYQPNAQKVDGLMQQALVKELNLKALYLSSYRDISAEKRSCFQSQPDHSSVVGVTIWKGTRAVIEIEHHIQGNKIHRESRKLRLVSMIDGWVSQQTINKGTELTQQQFVMQRIPYTGIELGEFSPLMSSRFIPANQVLTEEFAEALLPVMSGQQVKVWLKHKGIEITAKAIALDKGNIGQVVRVRMQGVSGVSKGIVAGKGRVHVSV